MAKDMSTQRFFFIELIAWWEGVITVAKLVKQFQISRQQAYQDIKSYRITHPENLLKQKVGYCPTHSFSPFYISADVHPYFHWFTSGQLLLNYVEPTYTYSLKLPARNVSVHVVRVLIQALTLQKSIEVNYVSLSNPEQDGRIFHPHTLVNTGLRWHVRGYCEKSQDYRDLVLSRCRTPVSIDEKSYHGAEQDTPWNTLVTIILAPDPRLSKEKQAVLSQDYQMEDNQLSIQTRAAMVNYLLHELQVNTKFLDGTPEAQQLVLVNRDDIKPWLFSS